MIERLLASFPERWPTTFVLAEEHRASALPRALQSLRPQAALVYVDHARPSETGLVGPARAVHAALPSLSDDAPVLFSRPSLDVLFESVAGAYRERAIGVVLTGANEDGAAGLAAIRARGGVAIVQDPQGAERPEMPRAALEAVPQARCLALEAIGPALDMMVGHAGARA